MEREINILGRKLRINIELSNNTKREVYTKPEEIPLEPEQPHEREDYVDRRGGLYGTFWDMWDH